MLIQQIREYDPISYVTSIGNVTVTFRFYWISSRGNPFGLPRCDIRLQLDEQCDEVTGLDVRDWFLGFPNERLEYYEDVVNTFLSLPFFAEGPGAFTQLALDYHAPILGPLHFHVDLNLQLLELDKCNIRPHNRLLALSLGHPDDTDQLFRTTLRHNAFERLQKIQLDLHLQIELMNC